MESEEDRLARLQRERKERIAAIQAKHRAVAAGSEGARAAATSVADSAAGGLSHPTSALAAPLTSAATPAAAVAEGAPARARVPAAEARTAAASPALPAALAGLAALRSDAMRTLNALRATGPGAGEAVVTGPSPPPPAAVTDRLAAAPPPPPPTVSLPEVAAEAAEAAEIDMFAADEGVAEAAQAAAAEAEAVGAVGAVGGTAAVDAFDDVDGYYKVASGEVLDGRYRVLGAYGRGVFGSVMMATDVRGDSADETAAYEARMRRAAVGGARDERPATLPPRGRRIDLPHRTLVPTGRGTRVAIKVLRAKDLMRRAGDVERYVCEQIAARDPTGRYHCVRLLRSFEHRGHLCLVYEALHRNLREVVRKFGKHVGLSLQAVRGYGRQLFLALRLMHSMGAVHADLKPDNILANDTFNVVKLCDFGSTFFEHAPDNDPMTSLVARFYRAPEIMLGLPYGTPVDVWSMGCCLYELFVGRILFTGTANNAMLHHIMRVKGPFPRRMVRQHLIAFDRMNSEPHFTEDLLFKHKEIDPVSQQPFQRTVQFARAELRLVEILLAKKGPNDDRKSIEQLADLLEQCFTLDPAKRITAASALKHPFFTDPRAKARHAAARASNRRHASAVEEVVAAVEDEAVANIIGERA